MTNKPVPKPYVMNVPAYVPGKHKIGGKNDAIVLSSNENPLGCSDRVAHSIQHVDFHRYPDAGAHILCENIAHIHGLDPSRIVCGAGSDEILQLLVLSYAGEGDEVIYTQYGFLMYPIQTQIAGATPVQVPETNYTVNVDAILLAITNNTTMIMIANPANPTGTAIAQTELIRLIQNTPSHIMIVLDGAYVEYCTWDAYTDGANLVDIYPNVVMTRTFSKAYGLASIRLGWAYAQSDVIQVLHRTRSPFNITSLTQAIGTIAVQDQDFIQKSVVHNTKWRQVLSDIFVQKGCRVPLSYTNFILVLFDTDIKAQHALKVFQKNGILVRSVTGYGIDNGLRITIGTESENNRIINALQGIHF